MTTRAQALGVANDQFWNRYYHLNREDAQSYPTQRKRITVVRLAVRNAGERGVHKFAQVSVEFSLDGGEKGVQHGFYFGCNAKCCFQRHKPECTLTTVFPTHNFVFSGMAKEYASYLEEFCKFMLTDIAPRCGIDFFNWESHP